MSTLLSTATDRKEPASLAWSLSLHFTIAFTAFFFDAEIRDAEAAGASIRVHWMIATSYHAFGLQGVRVLFSLLFWNSIAIILGHCIVGGNSGIAMIELDWIRRWTVLVEPIRVLEIFGANQVCHGFDADNVMGKSRDL
ncbi:MAG: hypothetical protein U0905_17795 [Pirellulales bacterium]